MKIHTFQNIVLITIPFLSVIKVNCTFGNEVKDYPQKINILLITADDLNWNSCGFAGCRVENITPNIDKLARESMTFTHGYMTSSVCQPSRGALMTGMYPHSNGIDGFYQTDKNILTFPEVIQSNGYFTAILGKLVHSTPKASIKWDLTSNGDQADFKYGRSPKAYADGMKEAIKNSKASGKPFFIMANSQDPHRPFSGSKMDKIMQEASGYESPSRIYGADEVEVPPFLPDIPEVREDIRQYFCSVKRLDDTVGEILRVLEEEGQKDNTMVIFLSDNGMAEPFAKTSCYLNGNKSYWIIRIPGMTKAGKINTEHIINGIDFMPTVLDILKIKIPKTVQGNSFADALKGKKLKGFKFAVTEFTETSNRIRFPMRAIQTKKYGYIVNLWSDTGIDFLNGSMGGMAWSAMLKAAENDQKIAERVAFYINRVPEELYDYENDPHALRNLINDPDYSKVLKQLTAKLERSMVKTHDPALNAFRNRNNSELKIKYMELQKQIIKDKHSLN